MAITSSAKKAIRSSARKAVFNIRTKKAMKKAEMDVRKLAASGKDASSALSAAYKALDKAAKKNFIKKNNASRMKSRLAVLVNKSSK